MGTSKFSYATDVPDSRKLLKAWLRNVSLTQTTYANLLNSLSRGKSHNEYSSIGKLLEYCPKLRQTLDPRLLDYWLDKAEGWAEVDTLCQGNFTAEELLSNWQTWQKLLEKFVANKNIHKRRAALVLLTGPVRHSSDERLAKLAFQNIEKLKAEKHILITKAISWVLRGLIKYHRSEVEVYITKNTDSLPKVAIRETINKLKSGRKSGK